MISQNYCAWFMINCTKRNSYPLTLAPAYFNDAKCLFNDFKNRDALFKGSFTSTKQIIHHKSKTSWKTQALPKP
ncbi:hypothetical protein HYN43_023810 [Mucilaginibacter celer]|uniref:Uncharacterized protein n=1 Tax=Mucilaginibacter celer TaxID=2305508 RepID=A0A494W3P0_9SPHI|nr:hypothetical protein HYN43_023810 [Mucilaginibacter celer]